MVRLRSFHCGLPTSIMPRLLPYVSWEWWPQWKASSNLNSMVGINCCAGYCQQSVSHRLSSRQILTFRAPSLLSGCVCSRQRGWPITYCVLKKRTKRSNLAHQLIGEIIDLSWVNCVQIVYFEQYLSKRTRVRWTWPLYACKDKADAW